MIRSRKKKFIISLIIFFSSVITASAGSTRDMGMGLFEYPWFIDGLQTYIYENPSMLGEFKDIAYAERTGLRDGQNMGGVIYNPVGKFTFALLFGYPVNNTVWNSEETGSLFHIDTYEAKSRAVAVTSQGQTLAPYQSEMLDGTIIDLSDPEDASAPITAGASAGTTSPELREQLNQRNFNAILAYDFGSFLLGLNFGYATSWNNNTDSDSALKANEEYNLINSEYSAVAGASVKLSDFVSIDFTGNLVMYTLDNNYTRSEPGIETDMAYKSSGAMDYGGSARINYKMTAEHLMHFNIRYSMLNRSSEGSLKIKDNNTPGNNVNATDTFDRTGQVIEAGVSDEFKLPKNIKAFLGFNVRYESFKNDYSGDDAITPANNVDKYSSEYNTITLPLIVGMEAQLTEKWQARFGLVQSLYKPVTNKGTNIVGQGSSKQPTSTSEVSSSETDLSVGLSYNISNFTIDWLANVDLFTTGPYFVSGKGTTSQPNSMAMAFAATYHFHGILPEAGDKAEPEPEKQEQDKPVKGKRRS